MSRMYSKLAKLQKDLAIVVTDEEREQIEDEIYDLLDQIELEESGKYGGDDDE